MHFKYIFFHNYFSVLFRLLKFCFILGRRFLACSFVLVCWGFFLSVAIE